MVDAAENFFRRNQPIRGAADFLRLHDFLEEDGEQAGRHAVAHRVGDVKTDVLFVQAEDVVEVPTDLPTRAVIDGEADRAHRRQRLRQKAHLQAAGEGQVNVDL